MWNLYDGKTFHSQAKVIIPVQINVSKHILGQRTSKITRVRVDSFLFRNQNCDTIQLDFCCWFFADCIFSTRREFISTRWMKSTWEWIDFLTACVEGEKSNVIYSPMLLNEKILARRWQETVGKKPPSPSRHEKLINHVGAKMVRLYLKEKVEPLATPFMHAGFKWSENANKALKNVHEPWTHVQSRLVWKHGKLNVIRALGALENICCLFKSISMPGT